MEAQTKIKIDGREFFSIAQDLTAAQDDYLMAHLRQAGATDVLTMLKADPEKKSEELLTRILLSGRTHYILAGCLTEAGKKWTRIEADRNAEIFAEITDRAEKLAMRGAIVGFVLGFFTKEDRSSESFPRSSSPSGTELHIEIADPGISETSL